MLKEKGKKTARMYVKTSLNFFNHTFTSFSSTGQKVLQTCPSLTTLLPICNATDKCKYDENKDKYFGNQIQWDESFTIMGPYQILYYGICP